jgi:nucleoside-diphosphate-sugar epimerase
LRAVVTGASGFLGGRLAAMLAADPRVRDVVGFDRVPAPDGAPWHAVTGEISRFGRAMPPDLSARIVVHAAAITSQASEADPDAAFATNVEGTRAVLAWCRAQPHPPRLLLLSSVSVFGGGGAVATEETAPDPRSTYGTTKLIAERLVLDSARRGEVDGVVLRLPVSVIRTATRTGPPGAGFVSDLVDHALRGLPFTVPIAADHALPVASLRASLGLAMRAALDAVPARVLHVPSLAVSAESALAALAACGVAKARVSCAPDPAVERLVAGWPSRLGTKWPAFASGLIDDGLEEVIRAHAAGRMTVSA